MQVVLQILLLLKGKSLSKLEIGQVKAAKEFSEKLRLLKSFGASLEFEKVDNEIFQSNLQTIDYNFDKISIGNVSSILCKWRSLWKYSLKNSLNLLQRKTQ